MLPCPLRRPSCKSRPGFFVCPHCNTAELIFITLHRRHIRTHLQSKILVVWAVLGIFVEVPFVSMYAFWVAVLAYVVLALGNFLTPLKSA